MGIQTIGEALSLGCRVVARCVRGREDRPASRSSRECTYRRELDLETLVCTRGRALPLSRLESRLRCPRCGNAMTGEWAQRGAIPISREPRWNVT